MIPFNRPYTTGQEHEYIQQAIDNGHLSGKGPFDRRCTAWLEERTGARGAFLMGSCTSALELGALLLDLEPGDEVIMPSFTFVTTATAFALRGAVPVFVDVRPDTFNLDETLIEGAITPRTKAIVPVHYGGVGCEMDPILELAEAHDLVVIEDAAHALMATYRGRPLGGLAQIGCVSFHETKNVIAGEGGALLVNDPRWLERAEIIQDKGTNRGQFFRGQVDKYTWVDLGSSFLTSEINAAFLWAQLEQADAITSRRLAIWRAYHERFAALEERGLVRRPFVPDHCDHNAHVYYLLLPDAYSRDAMISDLAANGIQAVFHYVPLHSSPAGVRYGRAHGSLNVTDDVSARLVRLPLWVGMEEADVDHVATTTESGLASGRAS